MILTHILTPNLIKLSSNQSVFNKTKSNNFDTFSVYFPRISSEDFHNYWPRRHLEGTFFGFYHDNLFFHKFSSKSFGYYNYNYEYTLFKNTNKNHERQHIKRDFLQDKDIGTRGLSLFELVTYKLEKNINLKTIDDLDQWPTSKNIKAERIRKILDDFEQEFKESINLIVQGHILHNLFFHTFYQINIGVAEKLFKIMEKENKQFKKFDQKEIAEKILPLFNTTNTNNKIIKDLINNLAVKVEIDRFLLNKKVSFTLPYLQVFFMEVYYNLRQDIDVETSNTIKNIINQFVNNGVTDIMEEIFQNLFFLEYANHINLKECINNFKELFNRTPEQIKKTSDALKIISKKSSWGAWLVFMTITGSAGAILTNNLNNSKKNNLTEETNTTTNIEKDQKETENLGL